MSRTRTLLAACAVVLTIPLAAAGCGGDDEPPDQVLEQTFSNEERISSGVLDLAVEGNVEGSQEASFTASLSGPFASDPENPNTLPQLDWTASVAGEGAGQSIDFEGGLVVTEDNAYVEYQDEAYEVGTDSFEELQSSVEEQAAAAGGAADEDPAASFKQGCERAIEAQGGDPSACDFDVTAWFTGLENEGAEDVEGAEATHISGQLDVPTMLSDLAGLATAVPSGAQGLDPALLEGQLDQAAEAVEEASFGVYSGVDDDLLRRLEFDIAIDPTALPGAAEAGIEGANLSFAITIGAVNEEQTIEAPADAQPISELGESLQIPGLEGGQIPGLGAGSIPGLDQGSAPGGGGGGGGAGATAPDAGQADAYLDCVAAAQGADELQACADELP